MTPPRAASPLLSPFPPAPTVSSASIAANPDGSITSYRIISRRQFILSAIYVQRDTFERSIDGVLTCVLGYEAAARLQRLTLATVLQKKTARR